MLRIGASSQGESRLHMLRIVRRGDRHDPHDWTVSCRFEGAFEQAFTEGRAEGLPPGEPLKNLVHRTARDVGRAEIETFGLALCERVLGTYPRVSRVRVTVSEQPWSRLEAGGKPMGQAFVAGGPERRTVTVTSNGEQVAVVAGLEQLTIMRSAGFGPPRAAVDPGGFEDGLQPLVVGTLAGRWTYTTADVTFGPYRQGVRNAIVETFGCEARRSVHHTLYRIADVILSAYHEISEVTLSLHERPYRPADPLRALDTGTDLFVAVEEPVGVVEVTVDRR